MAILILERRLALKYYSCYWVHQNNPKKQIHKRHSHSRTIGTAFRFSAIRIRSSALITLFLKILVELVVFMTLIMPLLVRLLLVVIVERISVILFLLWCAITGLLLVIELLICVLFWSSSIVLLLELSVRKYVICFSYLLKLFCHIRCLCPRVWVILLCEFIELKFNFFRHCWGL